MSSRSYVQSLTLFLFFSSSWWLSYLQPLSLFKVSQLHMYCSNLLWAKAVISKCLLIISPKYHASSSKLYQKNQLTVFLLNLALPLSPFSQWRAMTYKKMLRIASSAFLSFIIPQHTFCHHASPIDHHLSVLRATQPDWPGRLTSWVTLHQVTEQTTTLTLEHVIRRFRSLPSVNFVYRIELKLFSLKAKILSPTSFSFTVFYIYPILTNPDLLMPLDSRRIHSRSLLSPWY